MIPDTIERTIVINASPERVWSVLTEPAFLGRWFGNGEPVKMDFRTGGLLLFDHPNPPVDEPALEGATIAHCSTVSGGY